MAKAAKKTATPKPAAKPKPAPKVGKQTSKANPDKKSTQVLQLLRRQQGATINELSIATSWQPHSVRGFLSGSIKKRYGLKLTSEVVDGTRHYRVPA
ncbi:MAG: DUF3489 domain-containing protein [Rhodospirillaceae bacterium]|nr:DUF3489 domain-containing protein [Rhodospirillaceae bacterium]